MNGAQVHFDPGEAVEVGNKGRPGAHPPIPGIFPGQARRCTGGNAAIPL